MTVRLSLIRHGQTIDHEGASPRRMSGWHDVPLAGIGRRQAELLGARLRGEPRRFDALYFSPLCRAAETARALLECVSGPALELAGLREIHCGEMEGLPIREVQSRFPELWAANLRQDDEAFRWPGGESYREFRSRCVQTLDAIAAEHEGQCVALVTHAGVISQVIGSLRGYSAARWEPFRPGAASLSELEWWPGGGRLLSFDDRAHLEAATPP